MGKRRSVVMAAALVAVTTLIGSCAQMQPKEGSDPTAKVQEHLIQVQFNAKEPDEYKRLTVKKVKDKKQYDDEKDLANRFNRCTDTSDQTCWEGLPVDADGRDILDKNNLAEVGKRRDKDCVYFVSDAKSPGHTCVCYGDRCYCN
jgi:hypothetical protein